MPRAAGSSIPKYRTHRPTGQAVVTIAGRDHYLGPYGTKASRVEYDRLIGEWLAAGRPSTVAGPNDLTISELCRSYKKYAEGYYTKGGTLFNTATALRTLREKYGATLAIDFGPLALKALRQQWVDEGKARTYCNRLTDLVRRAFKWAAGEQLIPLVTWQTLTAVDGLRRGHTVAHETKPIGPVSDATVEATLPQLSPTVADMVRLQRLTGMRPDEVCRLRPCEVDRSADVWKYVPGEHKTAHHGRDRVVFIGPRGQEVLRRYLLRDAESFCFVPAEVVAERRAERHAQRRTPLSCGNRPGTNRLRRKPKRAAGERYNANTYRRAIHRACDVAFPPSEDLEGDARATWVAEHRWSPNRLRHAAATELRSRYGLEEARVVLGHSKTSTTEIYAERDLAKAAAIIREVG